MKPEYSGAPTVPSTATRENRAIGVALSFVAQTPARVPGMIVVPAAPLAPRLKRWDR